MIRRWSLALFAIALSGAASAQQLPAPLPSEVTGRFVIRAAVGEDPGFLEVPNAHALVGRHVEINSRLRLWTIFSGTITGYRPVDGTLHTLLGTAAPPKSGIDWDRHFIFYELAMSPCSGHGKPLSACPVFTIARDPASGEMALVTYPAGLAFLERVTPAKAHPKS